MRKNKRNFIQNEKDKKNNESGKQKRKKKYEKLRLRVERPYGFISLSL